MPRRMEDLLRSRARQGDQKAIKALEALDEPKPQATAKYRNQKTEANGRTYDSKLEAKVAGQIGPHIPQVSVPIGIGNRRLRLDFLVILEIHPDGSFTGKFADAKGIETDAWKIKAEAFKQAYGLEIEVIKK